MCCRCERPADVRCFFAIDAGIATVHACQVAMQLFNAEAELPIRLDYCTIAICRTRSSASGFSRIRMPGVPPSSSALVMIWPTNVVLLPPFPPNINC